VKKSEIAQFVQKAFSNKEWETLLQLSDFTRALDSAESTKEADGLIEVGKQLLHKPKRDSNK
jgi:hypothetical protein